MTERPGFAPYTPGRRAYLAYAATTGHLTHDGRDMPHWDGLTEIIRDAWEASATASTNELAALGLMVLNLDRCQHGRHAGDDCGTGMYNSTSCPGTSMGNPHMPPGTVIGYHLRGRIVVPERADKDKPEAWLRRETYDPRRETGSNVAPLVKGKCPACGGHSLYLANGGHVTCMRSGCPNPTQLDNQINKDTP